MARTHSTGRGDVQDDDNATERAYSREPPRRTSLIFQHDEDLDSLIEIEDAAGLVAWIQKNPELAFRMMQRREDTLKMALQELDDLKVNHTEEVFQLKERIARLKEQTPSAREQD